MIADGLVAAYFVGAFAFIFGGLFNFGFGSPKERRYGARAILLSPIWVFVIVFSALYYVIIGIKALWAYAEWKNND